MKKVENKEKISQFWFVVGLIVIFVFFMNTLFLYDRTNSLELKELQGHYERAIHSLKQHSPSQQIVGVKKEAESSSLSEQDKHRRKSKKNTLSFLFLGTSHFFSSHFSSSHLFSLQLSSWKRRTRDFQKNWQIWGKNWKIRRRQGEWSPSL